MQPVFAAGAQGKWRSCKNCSRPCNDLVTSQRIQSQLHFQTTRVPSDRQMQGRKALINASLFHYAFQNHRYYCRFCYKNPLRIQVFDRYNERHEAEYCIISFCNGKSQRNTQRKRERESSVVRQERARICSGSSALQGHHTSVWKGRG